MASKIRMFIVTDTGLRHLSRRLMQELIAGEPVLPEYAGTRQRVVEVHIEFRDKKPQRVLAICGLWFKFDDRGIRVPEDVREISSLLWEVSEKARRLVYAAIWGKNVLPLSSGKSPR